MRYLGRGLVEAMEIEDDAPLDYTEMEVQIRQWVASGPYTLTRTMSSTGHPRLRVRREDASTPWAEIELGDEIFFLDVDQGFHGVGSAILAWEQLILLRELCEISAAYLCGDYAVERRRRRLGKRVREDMVFTAGSLVLHRDRHR